MKHVLSNELFDGIPAEVTKKLHKLLGFDPNTRDVISASISGHLPEIVSTLLRIGIRRSPSGRQRPRKFDTVAWQNLEAAEQVTGLSKALLLRACLALLAKKGVTRLDLESSLEEINRMAPPSE